MTGKTHDNPAKAGGLKQGDKAIRKALSGKTLEAKLPMNFTYTTMNRVQELSRRMECRSDRRTFIVSIIMAVAFLALGVLTILRFYGASLKSEFLGAFSNVTVDIPSMSDNFREFGESLSRIPVIFIMAFGVMAVLLILDKVMRNVIARKYGTRR
ncbi:hypothetical protein [uncultured Muribaculum sp.]|jgi:hypothetical protein|uniref:hypothetical protein n=1 Tax=uncultured Muribaculum sp. TaxID=1918613 RepID=UPI0025B0A452|nr:hypothetical protein [uncultured Muribaculum sp.]